MASFVYDQVKLFAVTGNLNLTANNYRVALTTSGILTTDFSSKALWSQISEYEISQVASYQSVGYTTNAARPGEAITGVGMRQATVVGDCDDDLPDNIVFASDINYNSSTIDADYAVIMRQNYSDNTEYDLIVALDLRNNGATVGSNGSVFTIVLNSDSGGFLIIK